MPVQEWIHKLEQGAWARGVKVATALLAFLALAVFYDEYCYTNFSSQEAMDTAELARNLAEGNGYTTLVVQPLNLYLLQRTSPDERLLSKPLPDLDNPPVYPTLLAGLMKVFPRAFADRDLVNSPIYLPERSIAVFNQALFLIALLMVFNLGRRLFNLPVAWLTTCIFAASERFWRLSVSGLPTSLLVVIFLALAWCLVEIEERDRLQDGRRNLALALGLGAIIGLGGLTVYAFAWLILPASFFLALFIKRNQTRLCLVTALTFLVVLTPWLARNYSLSGNLFGSAGYSIFADTVPFPADHLERSLSPEAGFGPSTRGEAGAGPAGSTSFAGARRPKLGAGSFSVQQMAGLQDFRDKLLANTKLILQTELPRLGGNWLAAFFLAGLFLPFRNPALSRLRFFLLMALPLLFVVQALGRTHLSADSPMVNSENLLVLLTPLVLLYGVGLYFTLSDQVEGLELPQRTFLHGMFGAISCLPLIIAFLEPPVFPMSFDGPYWPYRIREIRGWMAPDELVMSDIPWAVAWYGHRQCANLTLDTTDQFTSFNEIKQVNAIYLTQRTYNARFLTEMLNDRPTWAHFALEVWGHGEVPTGFPLRKAPRGFLPDQFFLSDRDRWSASSPPELRIP